MVGDIPSGPGYELLDNVWRLLAGGSGEGISSGQDLIHTTVTLPCNGSGLANTTSVNDQVEYYLNRGLSLLDAIRASIAMDHVQINAAASDIGRLR